MRKYFLGVMAIIIATSLSAFTSVKKADSEKAVSLYWFEYDAGTGEAGIYLDYGERSDFFAGSCHYAWGPDCRRGYPITALVNQSDPELGVIKSNMHEGSISRHVSF